MTIKEAIKDISESLKHEGNVLKGEESKDRLYESFRSLENERTARSEFLNTKRKLFDVNNWSNIPVVGTATFELYNDLGNKLNIERTGAGNFIKIILPGPVPENWVKVTEVSEGADFAQFTVQPSHNPVENNENVTEHFFNHEARSIFRVERRGNDLYAAEIGINETINNSGEESGNRKIINTLISEGGWVAFQKHQWESLTEYLVGNNEQ